MEHAGDSHTNCKWRARNGLLMFGKWIRTIENRRKNRNPTDYSIIEITEKSPGDPTRLADSQTPVKVHRLRLMGKIQKK